MSRLFPLILALAVFLVWGGALLNAADESLICYRHKPTGSMVFACKQIKGPNDAFPRIYCLDKGEDNKPKPFTPNEEWEKFAADHPDCQQRQDQDKLKHVARQTGIPEPEVLDRALDVFLLAEELRGLEQLQDDMEFWQRLSLESLALEDERIANLDHDQGRTLDK